MKERGKRNKINKIFSPKNLLIGFVVIIIILLILNYYTLSKRNLDIGNSKLGELYQIKGGYPICDKECQEPIVIPGSEEGKYCQNKYGYCDANYGNGSWDNGICNKGHCAPGDNTQNNCGPVNCNECQQCVIKNGVPHCETDSDKINDWCSGTKGICENGECKILKCKNTNNCGLCKKCSGGNCVADDLNENGNSKSCGPFMSGGKCINGMCCYILGGCYS